MTPALPIAAILLAVAMVIVAVVLGKMIKLGGWE